MTSAPNPSRTPYARRAARRRSPARRPENSPAPDPTRAVLVSGEGDQIAVTKRYRPGHSLEKLVELFKNLQAGRR
ncbi:hypothetical protein ACFYXH_21810 [Streptomyces sp. NPDC002730]|uniref:hypothetical protein n=1 Tax=Streptomyces sp. NPDC002730 TaxID=3364662 RepID=UPI0036745468